MPSEDDALEESAHPNVLPVSPTLALLSAAVDGQAPAETSLIDRNTLRICALAIVLGGVAAVVAQLLLLLIALITNLAFFQRWSFAEVSPAQNMLGIAVLVVPVIGALVVGFMARYGSKAIRDYYAKHVAEVVRLRTNTPKISAV